MSRAKLGDVELNIVSSERLRHSAETSDKPVESGQDIVDHTKTNAPMIDIIGAIMGEGAAQKLNQLKKYQREGTLVKYIYRNEYLEMFILDIGTRHEVQIRDGYEFNITLKQIKVATAKSIELNVVDPVTKTASKKTQASVKPTTNKGTQQPQVKPVTSPLTTYIEEYTPTREETPQHLKPRLNDLVKTYRQSGGRGVGGSGSGGF